MCRLRKSASVTSSSPVISYGEFTRYGQREKTELLILSFYFMLIGNGEVLRLYLDTHAALPLLASRIFQFCGGKQAVAVLPLLSSAVNLSFQLSSAVRGGKLAIAALPPLASAVKSIFRFSSAPRGGKLEIALLLRVHEAEIFQFDFLSFFPLFCLLVGH